MIDIFSELGRRLTSLPEEIVTRAVGQNPWFTPAEVRLAAGNIARCMLSPRVLSAWLARYPCAEAAVGLAARPASAGVLVIMAGNIPLVGMHDLLCVLAAGRHAVVKPSSKDTVLMSWAVDQLREVAPTLPVTLVSDLSALPSAPEAVIAMGSDDAVRVFRDRWGGIPTLLRGSRSSLAVLDGTESSPELAALADDVMCYSGLGCRNVSLVFVPRGCGLSALRSAVSERAATVNPKYRSNYRQARALLKMTDTPHIDCGGCLLVENRGFPENISVLHYSFYDSSDEVKIWVDEHSAEVQCVFREFGRSQCPGPADYPDGRDTMEFLSDISRHSSRPIRREDPLPTLISIVGPTGSGKTDLAVEIASRLGAPIVSTDSRQLYRGMAIGTAQPSAAQLAAVPHYFIADREPTDRFTCADFEREGLELLNRLFGTHPIVVAVGGSGLYVDSLLNGLDSIPDIDPNIRKTLNDRLSREGLDPLLEELERLDPDYHATVDRQNPARVLRGLEVCLGTGRPFSSLRRGPSLHAAANASRAASPTLRPFRVVKIGVELPRPELYERIDRRVDAMMAEGLEQEARGLYPSRDLPSLQTVGYRELFAHFDGCHDLARAVELIKRNTRRYAKRQMTWFRRDPAIRWFHPREIDAIMACIADADEKE